MITGNGTFGVNQAQTNCSYTYNSIGNLTDKCGAVLSYGHANHPSAVSNHAGLGKNYTYDDNGNMLTRVGPDWMGFELRAATNDPASALSVSSAVCRR